MLTSMLVEGRREKKKWRIFTWRLMAQRDGSFHLGVRRQEFQSRLFLIDGHFIEAPCKAVGATSVSGRWGEAQMNGLRATTVSSLQRNMTSSSTSSLGDKKSKRKVGDDDSNRDNNANNVCIDVRILIFLDI